MGLPVFIDHFVAEEVRFVALDTRIILFLNSTSVVVV